VAGVTRRKQEYACAAWASWLLLFSQPKVVASLSSGSRQGSSRAFTTLYIVRAVRWWAPVHSRGRRAASVFFLHVLHRITTSPFTMFLHCRWW
jgi:hypothetical protein